MTDCKQERRRGARRMLLIILALIFGCCDVHIGGVRVWHSPAGQLADALHKSHGGESHE